MNNDDLIRMLDEQGIWLVRNGFQILPASTLREALHKAYDLSMQGNFSGPIVKMPNDEVAVDAHQIYYLWQRIDIKPPGSIA